MVADSRGREIPVLRGFGTEKACEFVSVGLAAFYRMAVGRSGWRRVSTRLCVAWSRNIAAEILQHADAVVLVQPFAPSDCHYWKGGACQGFGER